MCNVPFYYPYTNSAILLVILLWYIHELLTAEVDYQFLSSYLCFGFLF